MTETASGRRNDVPLKIDRKRFRIREKVITIILRPQKVRLTRCVQAPYNTAIVVRLPRNKGL